MVDALIEVVIEEKEIAFLINLCKQISVCFQELCFHFVISPILFVCWIFLLNTFKKNKIGLCKRGSASRFSPFAGKEHFFYNSINDVEKLICQFKINSRL